MQTETVLYFILAGIAALFIAGFQYYKNEKSMSKLNMLFLFLRFLTIFSILLLLINPKFHQETISIEKPNLIIAVDNSNSIVYLKQEEKVRELVQSIMDNEALKNKFNIDVYTFGKDFSATDTLTFSEKQTNINGAINQLSQLYKQTTSPTLLITDGNQTYGNDYEFSSSKYKQPIYPIILGDTTAHTDLKIQQFNVNRYAFLKNQFPVEAILVYNGYDKVQSKFAVKKGDVEVYSKNISFSKDNNSSIINFTLPASTVGVSSYRATLTPIENEKNKINNTKLFAVEVIDQKTKVAIVSAFLHPDLGVFKKSIEINEQWSATFLDPQKILDQIDDFQLVILYQPTHSFKDLYELLEESKKNKFIIVGTKTNLDFLNEVSKNYQHDISGQFEDYQTKLNLNYSPFLVDDINFESFPPLKSNYGTINFRVPFQTILAKTINGNITIDPLLATIEVNNEREAILLGENIWKWRAQSFMNTKSFSAFDDFLGKVVQYLASTKQRNRLNIEYETFYNGNTNIIVKAQYFDKNYQFDARQSLNITVKDDISGDTKILPFVIKNNNYQVDLSSLSPSKYSFTVSPSNESISQSGNFQILEYNVEQQFLSANVTKLQRLATNSNGISYFIDETTNLYSDLLNDSRYLPVQKSHKNSLPLIDWKYLLLIIALCLSAEWFLRKYNGLI
ncbi:VWA domain-containing protein [Aestuariivivens sp. NBU2969]|uniref:VWA domain-containing protein n=1 Tax=Aestuariivivens sp. NBU2969 TaxID=2873267 RepID=UPI001CBD9AB1|nr:VWA domain-containing protein [Aestuariivivens sp. NBU2969]